MTMKLIEYDYNHGWEPQQTLVRFLTERGLEVPAPGERILVEDYGSFTIEATVLSVDDTWLTFISDWETINHFPFENWQEHSPLYKSNYFGNR